MDHTYSLHCERLNSMCRICAQRVKRKTRDFRKQPKLCASYATELSVHLGIDVSVDKDGRHPKAMCLKCYFKLFGMKRAKILSNDKTITKARLLCALESTDKLWREFDPSISVSQCPSCLHCAIQNRGGRPQKAASDGALLTCRRDVDRNMTMTSSDEKCDSTVMEPSSSTQTENLKSASVQQTENFKSASVQQTENLMSVSVQQTENLKSASVQQTENLKSASVQQTENLMSVSVQQTENLKSASVQQTENLMSASVQQTENLKSVSVQQTENLKSASVQSSTLTDKTCSQTDKSPPWTASARYKQWIQNCQRDSLRNKPTDYLNTNSKRDLCIDHFEDRPPQFCNVTEKTELNSLSKAVPVMLNILNPPRKRTVTRPLEACTDPSPQKARMMNRDLQQLEPERGGEREGTPQKSYIEDVCGAHTEENTAYGKNAHSSRKVKPRDARIPIGHSFLPGLKQQAASNKASRGCGNWCAAINCHNSRKKGYRLFSFPLENERCKVWVQNCRRKDLLGRSSSYLNANCCLCANHFEASQFMNPSNPKCRLIWCAVPTLFDVPNPPRMLTTKRKLPTRNQLPAKKPRKHKQTLSSNTEEECPTARTLTPDVPRLGSTGSQTDGPDVTGTCLQIAVYILTAMPEFRSIEFEVRELRSKEPVLHLRRADLYGVLGWPCDPVLSTLTRDGLLTHRVVYRPPQRIPMSSEDVILDVDRFITEMRWLMGVKNVCSGISGNYTLTKDSLSTIQIFSSPELRIQSSKCRVVLLASGRTKCPSCLHRTQFLRKRKLDEKDSDAVASADVVVPIISENHTDLYANKEPRLSLDLVLNESMKTVLRKMLGVQTDSGGSKAQHESHGAGSANSSLGKDTQSPLQQNSEVGVSLPKSKHDVSQRKIRSDISLRKSKGTVSQQTSKGTAPQSESKGKVSQQTTQALLSLLLKSKGTCPVSSQKKSETAHRPESAARKQKKCFTDTTSSPLDMDCDTVSVDSVGQDERYSIDEGLPVTSDPSTKAQDSSVHSQNSVAFLHSCKRTHSERRPQVEIAEDVRLLQDTYKHSSTLANDLEAENGETYTASSLRPSEAVVLAPLQCVQPTVSFVSSLSVLHRAFPQTVVPTSHGVFFAPQMAQPQNAPPMIQSPHMAAQVTQCQNLPQMIQPQNKPHIVHPQIRTQTEQPQNWSQAFPSQNADVNMLLSGPQSFIGISSPNSTTALPVTVSLTSSNDLVYPVVAQANTVIKQEPDEHGMEVTVERAEDGEGDDGIALVAQANTIIKQEPDEDGMEVKVERTEDGEEDSGGAVVTKTIAYDPAVGAGESLSLLQEQNSSLSAVVSPGVLDDQALPSVPVSAGHSVVKQEPGEVIDQPVVIKTLAMDFKSEETTSALSENPTPLWLVKREKQDIEKSLLSSDDNDYKVNDEAQDLQNVVAQGNEEHAFQAPVNGVVFQTPSGLDIVKEEETGSR